MCTPLLVVCLLALGTVPLPACVEADLGDAPVFCNEWEPRCPEGYACVPLTRDGKTEEICRRGSRLTEDGRRSRLTEDGGLSLADDAPISVSS